MRWRGWKSRTEFQAISIVVVLLLLGCAGPTRTSTIKPAEEPAPQLPAPLVVQQKPPEQSKRTLSSGLETLAQELAASLPEDKRLLVAVLDFNDLAGNVSALGRLVNEELVTKLFQTRRVRIVERGLLEKALGELKLNLSGLMDPVRAKQLGKQVGADAIVTGTIADLGSMVKINARLIEVEKGDVLGAAGVEVTKDRVTAELMTQLLSGPSERLAVTKEVAQETSGGSPGSNAPAVDQVPSPSSLNSKKVGNIAISVISILASKSQIAITLDFFNQSGKELKLGLMYEEAAPNLSDEKGNVFEYKTGIAREVWAQYMIGKALTLSPKSSNDVVLYFEPKNRDIKIEDIGSSFAFSLAYRIYDPRNESMSIYNVSFRDLKAQVPK